MIPAIQTIDCIYRMILKDPKDVFLRVSYLDFY